nr:uncharacterized protein LOC123752062 [Procambarus clarkii]
MTPVVLDTLEDDPMEDDPVEYDPVEDDPVEYDPMEDDPVEDDPVEYDPVEYDPVEDDPVEDDPVEYDPVEDDPVEDDPVEYDPVEYDPVKDDPVEDDPVEDDPVEDDPVEYDPVEDDPVEDDPVEDDPDDPVEYDPVEDDPVEDDPVEDDPVEYDPVEDDPVEYDPVEYDPVEDDPVEEDPVEDDPVEDDPVEDDPVEDDPVEYDPVEYDPVEDDPVEEEETPWRMTPWRMTPWRMTPWRMTPWRMTPWRMPPCVRGRRSAGVEGQVVHFHVAVPVRRVYHHDHDVKQATCRLWKTGGPVPHDPAHDTVTVTLYQMNNLNRKRRRRKQEPVLIQSLNVSVAGDEWLSVDVTDTVRDWLGTPRDDAGVLVQCPDCGAAGVTIHTGANSSNTTYVPTLDVQTQVPAGRRMKRSPQMKRATDATWRRRGDCRDMNSSGRPRRSRCCRRSMKVRFKDLPDFDFVESPANFDAFYCSGRCPPRFNPANEHALLQSLIKLKHKKNIPRPCCAPTALKGLHILHFNDQGKLTTTYWDDMIVTECGCA